MGLKACLLDLIVYLFDELIRGVCRWYVYCEDIDLLKAVDELFDGFARVTVPAQLLVLFINF